MAPVTEEIRPPWKGPTFRQLTPAYRSGLICAVAMKADASMLETTSTQYAVRDTRVMMQEPLVRILTVMGASIQRLGEGTPSAASTAQGTAVAPKDLQKTDWSTAP